MFSLVEVALVWCFLLTSHRGVYVSECLNENYLLSFEPFLTNVSASSCLFLFLWSAVTLEFWLFYAPSLSRLLIITTKLFLSRSANSCKKINLKSVYLG